MISHEKMVMLELVQVNGISKMILDKCDNVCLEDRLNSMKDIEVKDIKRAINHLSRKDLIDLINMCPEIEDSDIEILMSNTVMDLNQVLFCAISEVIARI